MIFGSQNLFCEPSPLLEPLAENSGLVEWAPDGATYQAGPAPADTNVYLRITAPDGVDISAAAYFFLGDDLSAGVSDIEDQVARSVAIVGGVPAGTYAATLRSGDGVTILCDAGQLTFI